MSDPTPSDAPRPELRAGPIIGGTVLGVLVCWVWITVVLVGGFAASYSAGSGSGADALVVGALLLAALPLVVGIVLLVRRRSRLAGAGFLMGLAIGLIVGPGVCVALAGLG